MFKKIIFILLSLVLISTTALAWGDCPSSEVVRKDFINTDSNGIGDRSQCLPDNGLEPGVAKDIAVAINLGKQVNISETNPNQGKMVYHLLPISFFLTLLYLISHILSKKKIISIVNHRKFWNFLLLITFLASAIFGILLVIRINFGKTTPLKFDVLFWHVEMGIAMTAISIFHILWHWAYFKNLFNIKK